MNKQYYLYYVRELRNTRDMKDIKIKKGVTVKIDNIFFIYDINILYFGSLL